mmetsp:Transcript_4079/g.7221  ORF Transcript_4079/g.7221 Transcript_4079/m.7221 type:complete len:167 (+) Transcript_4079:1-501(+)
MSKGSSQLLELCEAEAPLPPYQFDTRGVWMELPSALRDELAQRGHMFSRGGLHAIEHALIALAPLCVTCEAAELGCQCTRRQGDEHSERLLIYERRSGGVGVAEKLLPNLAVLLQAVSQRVDNCSCTTGCLSCIHMSGCNEYNEGLDKQAAQSILHMVISGEGAEA